MFKQKSLFEIHAAVGLFGLAGLFGKWIALSPFIIVFGRVFFASFTLALLLLIMKQGLKITPRRDYLIFILIGFILSIHWVVFFKSIQVSTVAIGLLSYSSFPLFTVFLESLFFKEKIDEINIISAILCILGIFLIIPKFDFSHSVFQGVLWGLLAGLTFAVLTILNRNLSQKHSSLVIAFFQDFFATIFLFPFLLMKKPTLNIHNLLLFTILGVFCTAGSHTLFIKGMRQIKAQTASIISSLEPVYGIVLAFLLLHEIPALRTLLGGMIILLTTLYVSGRTAARSKSLG
jgi:drug/metabolite transporter (DMT)-like permease